MPTCIRASRRNLVLKNRGPRECAIFARPREAIRFSLSDGPAETSRDQRDSAGPLLQVPEIPQRWRSGTLWQDHIDRRRSGQLTAGRCDWAPPSIPRACVTRILRRNWGDLGWAGFFLNWDTRIARRPRSTLRRARVIRAPYGLSPWWSSFECSGVRKATPRPVSLEPGTVGTKCEADEIE